MLLDAFEAVFKHRRYIHRNSTIGDSIASVVYDDLLALGRSGKLASGVAGGRFVVNTANKVTGKKSRRGDGTFGELVPGSVSRKADGYAVPTGPVATLAIGTEVKIIATAMLRQIDRVTTALDNQARKFRHHGGGVLTLALVGLNYADEYTGYEGKREYVAETPPKKEAPEVARRLDESIRPLYDEYLLIPFRATNRPPYEFSFVNREKTELEYQSALLRISNEFERRW